MQIRQTWSESGSDVNFGYSEGPRLKFFLSLVIEIGIFLIELSIHLGRIQSHFILFLLISGCYLEIECKTKSYIAIHEIAVYLYDLNITAGCYS